MTRIYLVRHAEAEGNLYRRAHGHYNGLLTKNGLEQSERLGDWFSRRPVDAVYASDLYRAARTAGAVASACQKPVGIDPMLREVYLGEWEDRPWGEIARRHSDYMLWFDNKAPWAVKDAETVAEAGLRAMKALSGIAAAHEGQYVAVVSHGCVIRYVLERITGERVPHIDNASVSLVEWGDEGLRADYIGDNRHLGELSTHAKQAWWRDDPDKHPDAELWFSPARLPEDTDAAMDYTRRTWETIYGTTEGFHDEVAGRALWESAETNPKYLQFAMERDRRVGLIHMRDAGRLSVFDGHISLFCLDPEKRGLGLGAQLLGEAVSVSRACGKTGLSLRVFHQNTQALAFYRKMGFVVCGSEKGLFGTVIQMRLNIAVPESKSNG
ncbi:MAG: GNAT family N-acetyltransferase [Oscillospiraceae bacterium]|nr:GNAT family N-acetyltransferase [Oscillospiraceae bacterium]